jgi:hypothetical protein
MSCCVDCGFEPPACAACITRVEAEIAACLAACHQMGYVAQRAMKAGRHWVEVRLNGARHYLTDVEDLIFFSEEMGR